MNPFEGTCDMTLTSSINCREVLRVVIYDLEVGYYRSEETESPDNWGNPKAELSCIVQIIATR